MRYGMLGGMQATKTPDSSGVLGYWYNNGGLNNQKMALLGLILCGIRDKQAINLPYIYNKDQTTDREDLIPIAEVFNLDMIFAFARQHDLTILTRRPSGERGGWNYFDAFHDYIGNVPDRPSLQTILGAVASLKSLIVSKPAFLQLRDFACGALGIDTVVQLRIEADWRAHCEHTLGPSVGAAEDNGIGFMDIMSKVHATFPETRIVYVTSDEASMPASKDEIRRVCRSKFQMELQWKSDLLPAAFIGRLTSLECSIIDFEIAKYCPRFIGLTKSTFSNMLGIEKFASTRSPVRGHYIYNYPGKLVVERKDNGLTSAAQRAVLPAYVDTLLADGNAA